MKALNLVGRTFGRLIVLKRSENRPGDNSRWLCRCYCGIEKVFDSGNLLKGRSTSCGCLRKEKAKIQCVTHGHCRRTGRSRTYSVYSNMISRCCCSTNSRYSDYGGRGINVCDRWRESFEAFLEDMGECPYGLTIERIDNNGNYSPENCRWATRKEQGRNKRTSRFLTYNGKTMTLIEWSEETNIPVKVIYSRINRCGWSIERALAGYSRNNNPRTITHNGVTLTIGEWSKRTGLSPQLIRIRIDRLRWSIEHALTEPRSISHAHRKGGNSR